MAQPGGLGTRSEGVAKETEGYRQVLEVRAVASGLPIEDGGTIDPNPQRNLPLKQSEIQAPLPEMIADRPQFRRIRSINGFRRSEHEITKWQRRGDVASISAPPGGLAPAPSEGERAVLQSERLAHRHPS